MVDNRIELSANAKRFALDLEESRLIAKVPELFLRSWIPREKADEICIFRRWNSHTPSVWNAWGGGYFISWQGKGTIVDPGHSFLKLLRMETPYDIGDIQMVITTHDHVDHCQDLGTIISLFREYNKWLDLQNKPPRTWDLVMSHGVADQFNSFLVHPENAPFIRWKRALFPEDITQIHSLPSFVQKKSRKDMQRWQKHLSSYALFCQKKIAQDYKYKLKLLSTRHKELLGGCTALGLQFKLIPGGKIVVISGDTGYDDRLDLVNCYKDAHLLILHVGTMEGIDEKPLSEHLGLDGVTKVLLGLCRSKLALVILTEWGYEFGRLIRPGESGGRSRFTNLVIERLHDMGCNSYYAAISPNSVEGKIPIIPADISLRIQLPDFQIWSEDKNNGQGGFEPYNRIWADDQGEEIKYHTII
jgi:ribonuclease BN (tRNA processing enzyme)